MMIVQQNNQDLKFSVRPMADAEVEVDIFSGRPNPTWKLSDDLSGRLIREAAQLPVIEKPETFEGLGYRGFLIHFDLAETWRVQGKILEINLAGSIIYKKNKTRSIENSLLESGKPYLDEKLFQRLERDIRCRGSVPLAAKTVT